MTPLTPSMLEIAYPFSDLKEINKISTSKREKEGGETAIESTGNTPNTTPIRITQGLEIQNQPAIKHRKIPSNPTQTSPLTATRLYRRGAPHTKHSHQHRGEENKGYFHRNLYG